MLRYAQHDRYSYFSVKSIFEMTSSKTVTPGQFASSETKEDSRRHHVEIAVHAVAPRKTFEFIV
jgi:hypothetical protein